MNTLGKSLIISAAAAAMTFASLSAASADDGWHHHHDNSGWVAGAAGLATGLVVGSVIANQPRYVEPDPYYDAPPPPPSYYYRAPTRVYYPGPAVGLRPWSPQWMRYCYDRYGSFDARTGTYVGYDGARHFCVAN
jgi:hypothetical protein